MFNSTVVIRGISKPIFVSEANAKEIQRIFSDKSIDSSYTITMGKQSFRKADVKFIDVVKDGSKSEMWEKVTHEFYEDEKKNRNDLLKTSAESRGNLTDMFLYLYKFSAGEFPTTETINECIKIQTDFFRSNPNRTLCDLNLLKPLIVMKNAHPNLFENGYFRLIDKAIFRDMQLSGQLTP